MTRDVRHVVVLGAETAPALAARAAVAFGQSGDDPDTIARWQARAAAGQVYGLTNEEDHVLGHCRVRVVDHYFGQRRVGCQHVTSVAVAPEHRGKGVATQLVRELAQRALHDGVGLSLLFPAMTGLYRSMGWEHAGNLWTYFLDARCAPRLTPSLSAATGDAAEWTAIQDCYDRWAQTIPGAMVRTDDEWAAFATADYRYVLVEADRVTAYALVNHQRAAGDWQYTLRIQDWAATTAAGLRAIVGFVGSHGTLAKNAEFRAPSPNPWAQLVAEQDVKRGGGLYWMARGLDLTVAIAQRGFPPGLTLDITLAIDDPWHTDAATGPATAWRLTVADGRGHLAPTDAPATTAEVALQTRAVGPLFTGFRAPSALALGGLANGPTQALVRLGAAFAGPPPSLMDFF